MVSVAVYGALVRDAAGRYESIEAFAEALRAELARVGIDEHRREVESFLADQDAYLKQFGDRIVERLAERGLLELDDPLLAANHFNWLIMSAPINRAMLLGNDKPLRKAELGRYVDNGVRAFLSAYGKR